MLEINSKSLVFIIKNIGKISDTKRMKYYFRRENSDETFGQIFKPIAQKMKIIELHAISKKIATKLRDGHATSLISSVSCALVTTF